MWQVPPLREIDMRHLDKLSVDRNQSSKIMCDMLFWVKAISCKVEEVGKMESILITLAAVDGFSKQWPGIFFMKTR